MAMYLYHVPVFHFLDDFLGFGKQDKYLPHMVTCRFVLVLVVGTFVTFCIEEPVRNMLTAKKPNKIEQA